VEFVLPVVVAVAWVIDKIRYHDDLFDGHGFRVSELISLGLAGVGVGLCAGVVALVLKRGQRQHDALRSGDARR